MLGAGGQALTQELMKASGRVKRRWRKWTYELPLAFSDALWDICVVQFAAFLDRLTLRKAIEYILILMLAIAFAQSLPIELAWLFAGDTLMYLEFLIALRLAAGKLYLKEILRFALRLAQMTVGISRAAISIGATRFARLRQSRRAGLPTPRRNLPKTDDEPAFCGFAFAAA
jgi:hypothetical protein